MGLFQDAMKGFLGGVVAGAADNLRSSHSGVAAVQRFMAELGWSVDEKFGDKGIILHFRDPVVGTRKVIVVPDDCFTLFRTYSGVFLSGNAVRPEVLAYLLRRNHELATAAWQVQEMKDETVAFALEYCAFTDGLNSAWFKSICEDQAKECASFDAKMKAVGLL